MFKITTITKNRAMGATSQIHFRSSFMRSGGGAIDLSLATSSTRRHGALLPSDLVEWSGASSSRAGRALRMVRAACPAPLQRSSRTPTGVVHCAHGTCPSPKQAEQATGGQAGPRPCWTSTALATALAAALATGQRLDGVRGRHRRQAWERGDRRAGHSRQVRPGWIQRSIGGSAGGGPSRGGGARRRQSRTRSCCPREALPGL